MTRLRFAALATVLCGTVVPAGWAVSELTGFDWPRIEKPALFEDQRAASLSAKAETASANTEPVDAPQPTTIDKTVTTAAGTTGTDRAESIVETALADSSRKLPAPTTPVQTATASEPDSVHTDTGEAVRSIETVGECLVSEICIDQYLWSLYQRTPKREPSRLWSKRKSQLRRKAKRGPSPKSLPSSSTRTSRGRIRRQQKKPACH